MGNKNTLGYYRPDRNVIHDFYNQLSAWTAQRFIRGDSYCSKNTRHQARAGLINRCEKGPQIYLLSKLSFWLEIIKKFLLNNMQKKPLQKVSPLRRYSYMYVNFLDGNKLKTTWWRGFDRLCLKNQLEQRASFSFRLKGIRIPLKWSTDQSNPSQHLLVYSEQGTSPYIIRLVVGWI